jgi:adenylate cyclase
MQLSTALLAPKVQANLNPIRVHSVHTGRGAPIVEKDIGRWLLVEGRNIENDAILFDELCWRIVGAGVPLWRATLHIGTLHPQLLGFGSRWRRDRNTTERIKVLHGAQQTDDFLRSPIKSVILDGASVRLDPTDPTVRAKYPLIADLFEQGATDYAAKPLSMTGMRHQAITAASDAPGGFTEVHHAVFAEFMPALTTIMEMRAIKKMGVNLIETYFGRHAGPRILDGQILRRVGERMRAVVLASDLRNFTMLSDRLPGEEVIEILDDYFEAIAEPVHAHGGDILKFVGDGIIAIFPTDGDREGAAAESALDSALAGLKSLDGISAARQAAGRLPLRAGMGLHLGDVIYGNVGSPDRLDFTAIGPAVNLAARLENITKRVDRPLVMSSDFATAYRKPLASLGFHPVRGISEPEEIFGLP